MWPSPTFSLWGSIRCSVVVDGRPRYRFTLSAGMMAGPKATIPIAAKGLARRVLVSQPSDRSYKLDMELDTRIYPYELCAIEQWDVASEVVSARVGIGFTGRGTHATPDRRGALFALYWRD